MSKTLYALNVTKQSFISLGVTVAETQLARLRGLLSKFRVHSDEGVWVPSRGVHTIGLRCSIDVIYLDAELSVIHLIESLGPFRIAPLRLSSASVLELPTRSIYGSGTEVGDQLRICTPEDMEAYCSSLPAKLPRR